MFIGLVAGLMTGALWGLTFVAPLAVSPVSAWDLTVARYEVFGLACLLLMISPRFRPGPMSGGRIAVGLLLGGVTFTGYVSAIFLAVQYSGIAIPPLIVGLSPIALSLLGDRDGPKPWGMLGPALVLIAAGLLLVNLSALTTAGVGGRGNVVAGILFSVAALATWVAYAAVNARVMRAPDPPDGLRWTGLQGVGAALGSLLLLPLTTFRSAADLAALFDSAPGLRFVAWITVMGLGGSWLATWCWVIASRRLPLALASQLIVGETLFGLLYGFLWERRWPNASEGAGAALQVAGVMLAIAAFGRRGTPAVAAPEAESAAGSPAA